MGRSVTLHRGAILPGDASQPPRSIEIEPDPVAPNIEAKPITFPEEPVEESISPAATVLFCINEDPLILRPLLVTHTENGRAWGELFLCAEKDRKTSWCIRNMFTLPSAQLRSLEVKDAAQGLGLGQWRFA